MRSGAESDFLFRSADVSCGRGGHGDRDELPATRPLGASRRRHCPRHRRWRVGHARLGPCAHRHQSRTAGLLRALLLPALLLALRLSASWSWIRALWIQALSLRAVLPRLPLFALLPL